MIWTNDKLYIYGVSVKQNTGSDVIGHRLLKCPDWFFFLCEGLFLHNMICNYCIEYFCHILTLTEGRQTAETLLTLENMQHFKQCNSYDYNCTKLTNAAVFFRSLSKKPIQVYLQEAIIRRLDHLSWALLSECLSCGISPKPHTGNEACLLQMGSLMKVVFIKTDKTLYIGLSI